MKKSTIKIIALVLAIMISLVSFVYATENITTDLNDLEKSTEAAALYTELSDEEIHNGDYYAAEDEVTVTGVIEGNVFAFGKKVTIKNAEIHGDVFAAAKEIEIEDSIISCSAFLASQDLFVKGESDFGGIYVASANKAEFSADTIIERDVRIATGKLNYAAFTIGNVYAYADKIDIEEGAVISGAFEYTAKEEAVIPESAKIGNVNFSINKVEETEATKNVDSMSILMDAVAFIVKVAIVAGFIILFTTKFAKAHTVKDNKNKFIKLLQLAGKGFIVWFLIPIISIVLMFTVIGIGLGFILLAIYAVLIFFTIAVSAVSIAYVLFEDKFQNDKAKLFGISLIVGLVIYVLSIIPYVGVIISIFCSLVGMGSITTAVFMKEKAKKVVAVVEEKVEASKDVTKESKENDSNGDTSDKE